MSKGSVGLEEQEECERVKTNGEDCYLCSLVKRYKHAGDIADISDTHHDAILSVCKYGRSSN